MSAKKSAKKAKSIKKTKTSKPAIPPLIYAQASPYSIGGVSMFEAQNQINADTFVNFLSETDLINRAVEKLKQDGFEVLQVSAMTINIAAPAKTYERAFNTKIYAEERPAIKEWGKETTATFLDSPDTDMSGLIQTRGTSYESLIEGVAIEEPRYFFAPSMFAPLKSYWHLRVPGDVSLGCNADRAHRAGVTGRGVKVAMVDSGWFKHPYFVGRGYRAAPVVLGPAAANPLADESGHGTGESANIFALAPDVELLPVKINFVNSVGAFNAAVGLNPDIITCSWGSHRPAALTAADNVLAAAIAAAVASGITVIFSAGNSHAGFPGQHPDVISAGGVFMKPDESLQASNYASGFMSNIYPNRRVPDLSGLVGMQPKAIYIMLPLEPKDQIDIGNSGGAFPNGDETANNDGWAAFSGTSAAAPQLAGAAALIKQACPGLKPADVKDILMKTARDVTAGLCNAVPGIHGGLPATPGPDTATGNGLVDAHKAMTLAKVRCLGPIVPILPAPIPPIPPIIPQPIVGPQPPQPIVGPQPPQPPRPPQPIVGPQPPQPPIGTTAAMVTEGGKPHPPAQLSAEDLQTLEEMILTSDLELE